MNTNYFIAISPNSSEQKDTIHDAESKLKIGVFNLFNSAFKPKKGEVHYYVSDQHTDLLLAFETEGYQRKHKNLLVLDMIARYCVYLGFGEAIIHSTFPGIS